MPVTLKNLIDQAHEKGLSMDVPIKLRMDSTYCFELQSCSAFRDSNYGNPRNDRIEVIAEMELERIIEHRAYNKMHSMAEEIIKQHK